jgi:hypothetical protein
MHPIKFFAAMLACLMVAASSPAAVLSAASGNAVTDYSGVGLAAFDLDTRTFERTQLAFVLDADDLLAPVLRLNAIVRNLSGAPLQHFTFRLDGIAFAGQGSVTPTFGTLASLRHDSQAAVLRFSTPEYAEFHFGNPLALAGNSDWLLDLAGMQAGQRFTITATVPEPATLTLMLASLFLFAIAVRSRDGNDKRK